MNPLKTIKGNIISFSFLAFLLSVPSVITALDYPSGNLDGTEDNSQIPTYYQLSTSYTYDEAGNRIRRKYREVHLVQDSLIGSIVWNVGDEINGKTVVLTPRPSEGELTVDIIGYEQTDNCTVGIYDINGRIKTARSIQSATTEIEYPRQQNQTDIIYLKMNGESAAWRITDAE